MMKILSLKDVCLFKKISGRKIPLLSNISIDIHSGERIFIVGPSGSSKTLLARVITGIIKPSKGSIKCYYNKKLRYGILSADPYGALSSRYTIYESLSELLKILKYRDSEINDIILNALGYVGLDKSILDKYPKEISNLEKQLTSLARALSLKPDILILDDPTLMLDLSDSVKFLQILDEVFKNLKIPQIYLTRNIEYAFKYADRIYVILSGRIIEEGLREDIMKEPKHPYTIKLCSEIRYPEYFRTGLVEDLSMGYYGVGCPYQRWCRYKTNKCMYETPELTSVSESHKVACHLIH